MLATAQPWRTAWERLRRNYVVRWSAVVGIAGALFLAPFAGLVVPIAQEFRADRPISGASFLMASISRRAQERSRRKSGASKAFARTALPMNWPASTSAG